MESRMNLVEELYIPRPTLLSSFQLLMVYTNWKGERPGNKCWSIVIGLRLQVVVDHIIMCGGDHAL